MQVETRPADDYTHAVSLQKNQAHRLDSSLPPQLTGGYEVRGAVKWVSFPTQQDAKPIW